MIKSPRMHALEHIRGFLDGFLQWAQAQADIQAVTLVGSYARGQARDDSDIDLVILTDRPRKYLEHPGWMWLFGPVERHQTEDYGKLISLRVWYVGGPEVEYGLTARQWVDLPLDAGTRQVIEDGMLVLFEREGLVSGRVGKILERKKKIKHEGH